MGDAVSHHCEPITWARSLRLKNAAKHTCSPRTTLQVVQTVFAKRGCEATSVEPIAAEAAVAEYVAEAPKRSWRLIIDGVDGTSLRPGVEISQSAELVMLALYAFADRLLSDPETPSSPPPEMVSDIAVQVGEYLQRLRCGLAPPATEAPFSAGTGWRAR